MLDHAVKKRGKKSAVGRRKRTALPLQRRGKRKIGILSRALKTKQRRKRQRTGRCGHLRLREEEEAAMTSKRSRERSPTANEAT